MAEFSSPAPCGTLLGSVHLAIWAAHRILEQARQTQKHIADLFGLEQQGVGLWLGVDKLCAAPSYYPLGPAAGVHTMMKGIATRLEELAALSCGGSLLDESPVG